ncbi:MAG: ABC transporter substrate-binding protein [Granulosicoccus sp.]
MSGVSTISLAAQMLGALATFCLSTPAWTAEQEKPLCLYVSSYHQGFAWSDGVERGLRNTIDEQCTLVQLDMNTQREKTPANKILAGKTAYKLYQNLNPDIVISSDDNAVKYFVVPYLVDTETPVVFSGISWSLEEYGLPANNITGIVRVAHIESMLSMGLNATEKSQDDLTRIAYLGAKTLTETRNYNRVKKVAKNLSLKVDGMLVEDFEAWKKGFKRAQDYDLVIIGDKSGIDQWNTRQALATVNHSSTKPSMTNHKSMLPYSLFGFTSIAEEFGEWAATSAIAILNGMKVFDIPIVSNQHWDTWVNKQLLKKQTLKISESIFRSAKEY